MQTVEYNHNDFTNEAEADKALMVRFFYKERPDKTRSAEEGRPVFKEVVYIEMRVAGQRDVQACRPATEADKRRFHRHFEAFEKRIEPPTEGMPLHEWPQITRSEAEELSFLHVKTVEQLASMKDSNLSKFRGGYALRDKAVKWLSTTNAATEDREKEELKAQLADMQKQLAALMAVKAVDKTAETSTAETPNTLSSELDEPETPNPAPSATRSRRKTRG